MQVPRAVQGELDRLGPARGGCAEDRSRSASCDGAARGDADRSRCRAAWSTGPTSGHGRATLRALLHAGGAFLWTASIRSPRRPRPARHTGARRRPSWLAPLAQPTQQTVAARPAAPLGIHLPRARRRCRRAAGLPFWVRSGHPARHAVLAYRGGGEPPASESHFEPRRHRGREAGMLLRGVRLRASGAGRRVLFWLLDGTVLQGGRRGPNLPAAKRGLQISSRTTTTIPSRRQSTQWHDPAQQPGLLEWTSSPIVRLAWCRVHNGELKQPRRSYAGVQVMPGGHTRPHVPGTQSGLARVSSRRTASCRPVHAEPTPPASATTSRRTGRRFAAGEGSGAGGEHVPGGLPAYPYFAYVDPGASLFPKLLYSPALAIACALRTRCRFETALKWYALVFNPLERDDTWIIPREN